MAELIPVLGIIAGIIIPLGVFTWLYFEEKNKRATLIEISKNIQDPAEIRKFLSSYRAKKSL